MTGLAAMAEIGFGDPLPHYCAAAGLTQEQLAEWSGSSARH